MPGQASLAVALGTLEAERVQREAHMERATTGPAARNRHAPEMRPDMMTDSEINAELKTASGERLAALQAEREDRRVYRASMRPASLPKDPERPGQG
jgi:hypothetical protein